MNNSCVVVILTFNSAAIINETVSKALLVSPNIFVVDSGSTDGTKEIVEKLGCTLKERPFTNYSDQRNWAIDQVGGKFDWQLHLDSDEVLDEVAVKEIGEAIREGKHHAYMLRRRDYFMGRELKHSGVNPWHLRLFRSGVGRCENRLYDQHFYAIKQVHKLTGYMHDKNTLSLSDWIARHNKWSDYEAKEIIGRDSDSEGVLKASAFGDARERTRYLKIVYYRYLPSVFRAMAYFTYRYLFKLGFLDGRAGFYFAFFQALWFRMLVDVKVSELNARKSR